MSAAENWLDQALDIAGSLTQAQNYTLADENSGLGAPLTGQTGSAASLTDVTTGIVTITGVTGMTTQSPGRFITISGCATGANNGTFLITEYVSATSVKYANSAGVAPDGNNGSITWVERNPYSLEDDMNYVRTDRAAIKGVNFYAAIPTYERPTAVGTNVPANLNNIAGKTTDAKTMVRNVRYAAVSVAATNTEITLTDSGNLPHADATDRTGVPIFDGADSGQHAATYVEITNPSTGAGLEVLGGGDEGKRIYGRTNAGSATEPNEVEVEFRAVANGADLSTSVAYTWESGQPTSVDMYIGMRERMDNLDETALRTVLTSGITADADMAQDLSDIRDTIDESFAKESTSLTGLLTNTGNYYAFSDLPDATPSIVEALNTLNAQIGDRDYTGSLLVDGEDITTSLQTLANNIGSAGATRTIERLTADVNAGTAHTLPGGKSYTLDGTGNGVNMWVFWRGIMRSPGAVSGGNDYAETSTTQITPHKKIRSGDHIHYLIIQ